MLARDVQSNQMSFACRSGPGSLPNGNYEEAPLSHLNSNFYVDYSTQAGHGVSAVTGNGYPGSVFRKPSDNKIPGFSMRKYQDDIYNSQVPVTYSPMSIPERVQNSSYFPSHASGPWSEQTSIYDNPFITPASLHVPLKPAPVTERPRFVLNEPQNSVNESLPTYGNYCYVDNSGHFINTLYNSGNLASNDISYDCTNKQYSLTALSPSFESPTCCPDAKEVTCPNLTTQEGTLHATDETRHDDTHNPPYRNWEDAVDPQYESVEEIQKISDIIRNEMKDDTLGGGFQENCTSKNALKFGPLVSKKFSTFRRLVKQFYHDSRHRAKKDEGCSNERTSFRNSHSVNEMFSGTNEGRWFTEQKSESSENSAPSDSAIINDETESSKNEDGKEKNIILSLVCPDLKVKDPLVYLKFPFYSVEGEQLRPFLKRCLKLNDETTESDQNVQNISQIPKTSHAFDDEPSCNTGPMEYSDSTRVFNQRNGRAFISEFRVEDLKQTISCIEQSYVEHLGKLSSKLSKERKQWILDVYADLCRLREKIFGPLSPVKAELQHEIFYATGINVDATRNIVSQYSNRVYKQLPNVVKFVCSVPGFKELNFDDKRTLISESLLEYWFLGWFNNVDDNNSILIDVDHQILLCVDILKESFSSEHNFIKAEMEIAGRLSKLNLTPTEVIVLRTVILLHPTRAGIKDPELLDSMYRKCRECLRFLLYQNHDDSEKILSEIDAFFLEFRRVSGQYRNNRCKEFILDITQNADFLAQISAGQ